MIIGLLTVELFLPESASLKDKRQIIKSLKDNIHLNYNVSTAEVDYLDLWQRSILGIAAVNADKVYLDGQLNKIVDFINKDRRLDLTDYQIQFL